MSIVCGRCPSPSLYRVPVSLCVCLCGYVCACVSWVSLCVCEREISRARSLSRITASHGPGHEGRVTERGGGERRERHLGLGGHQQEREGVCV